MSILAGLRIPAPRSGVGVLAFGLGLGVSVICLDLGVFRLGLGVGPRVASRLLAVEFLLEHPGESILCGLCIPASPSGVGVLAFRFGLGVCVDSLDLRFLRLGLGVADVRLELGNARLRLADEALLERLGVPVASGLGGINSRPGLGVCVLSLVFAVLRLGLGVADFLEARCFAGLLAGL